MAGQNIFNSIKLSSPNTNRFDLSHDVKMSLNMGELVPTMVMDCVPGDRVNLGCDSLLRFAPLISPVMHRVDVYMHYFFVPNRLLWDNWEKWITGGNDPNLPAFPTITQANDLAAYTRLADYLGIPIPLTGAGTIQEPLNAMPFAAYQMIFSEYYRDQNMQEPVNFKLIDGDNAANIGTLTTLRNRAWEHDYFTASLPFAQKGQAVNLPLGIQQDVPVYRNTDPVGDPGTTLSGSPEDIDVSNLQTTATDVADDQLYADTSSLTVQSTTINDLRTASRLQEWLEKAARGGSRYVENILSFFGIKSPDSRLQRPEYITGTKAPVVISEVLSTSETTTTPQGNMAGHGVSVTQGKYGSYFCQEHGYILGIMSVMPKTAYQQGIPKHFLKTQTPLQFYWPQFANLGEQEVLNKEVYAYDINGGDTFGYVPRYAEYKYIQNRVAGDFRTTLDFWHMGRIFENTPSLNLQFVTSNPTDRIFAVTDPDVQHLYCHILHKISAVRPMPKFGTPTF